MSLRNATIAVTTTMREARRNADQHDGLAFDGQHLEQQILHVGARLGVERRCFQPNGG